MTAALQRHVSETGSEIAQRRRETGARGVRTARTLTANRQIRSCAEELAPVLRGTRVQLSQFEILAQPVTRPHQVVGQEGHTVPVAPPRQEHHRAFGEHAAAPRLRIRIGRVHRGFGLGGVAEPCLRFREPPQPGLLLGHQPVESAPARRGDAVARDPARRIAGDPALQRHGLRNRRVHDRRPGRAAALGVPHHDSLVHFRSDRQNRARLAQAAEHPAGLACQHRGVRGDRARPDFLHGLILLLRRGPGRYRAQLAEPAQRAVDQWVVTQCFDPANLSKHRRGMAACHACKLPDRLATFGVSQIVFRILRHPRRQIHGGPALFIANRHHLSPSQLRLSTGFPQSAATLKRASSPAVNNQPHKSKLSLNSKQL